MAKKTKQQIRLSELESEIKSREVHLAYERLKFAGLILKSGLCWFKGRYYLFVDRLLPVKARIELLEGALEELDELAAAGKLDRPEPPAEADAGPPVQETGT
ncbi:MAG: hypothetical protein PVG60_05965 [Desulfarculaceae bacterium]